MQLFTFLMWKYFRSTGWSFDLLFPTPIKPFQICWPFSLFLWLLPVHSLCQFGAISVPDLRLCSWASFVTCFVSRCSVYFTTAPGISGALIQAHLSSDSRTEVLLGPLFYALCPTPGHGPSWGPGLVLLAFLGASSGPSYEFCHRKPSRINGQF